MKKFLLSVGSFFVLAVSFAALQFSSVKKASVLPVHKSEGMTPVTGIWTGFYTTDQVKHEPASVTFMILPDGVILKRCKVVGKDEYSLAKGSWKLEENIFSYTDTAVLYSGGSVINTGTATFDGNELRNFRWKDLAVQIYTGDFSDVKKISSESSNTIPACATTPKP
jgi:hypothetical protein